MCVPPIPRASGQSTGEGEVPGTYFQDVWSLPAVPGVFAAVIAEQKRLKLHEFPTLYRREQQHVLCIDPMCWAQHGGWMRDERWGDSGEC